MSSEAKPLPIVEVLNLAKKYGAIQALKGISFSIGKGEIVDFWPNGAGKSTTLRILSGLIPLTRVKRRYASRLGRRGRRSQKACRIPGREQSSPEDLRVVEYLEFRAKLMGWWEQEA